MEAAPESSTAPAQGTRPPPRAPAGLLRGTGTRTGFTTTLCRPEAHAGHGRGLGLLLFRQSGFSAEAGRAPWKLPLRREPPSCPGGGAGPRVAKPCSLPATAPDSEAAEDKWEPQARGRDDRWRRRRRPGCASSHIRTTPRGGTATAEIRPLSDWTEVLQGGVYRGASLRQEGGQRCERLAPRSPAGVSPSLTWLAPPPHLGMV